MFLQWVIRVVMAGGGKGGAGRPLWFLKEYSSKAIYTMQARLPLLGLMSTVISSAALRKGPQRFIVIAIMHRHILVVKL